MLKIVMSPSHNVSTRESFSFPVLYVIDSKDEFHPLKQVYDVADVPVDVGQSTSAEIYNREKSKLREEYSVQKDNIIDKISSAHSDSDV